MKGDFTRETFNARDHFNRVLMQQGRVMMDADWNEQEAIEAHLERTQATDVIGACGAPMHDAGFAITAQSTKLFIGPGRYYTDGILCENEGLNGQPIVFNEQPDTPNAPDPMGEIKKTGFALVYLDVWERHVTALDVARLREVALSGPDTMTRVRTIWQVKLLPVEFKKTQVNQAELRKLLNERAKVERKIQDAQAAGDTAAVKELQAKFDEVNQAIAVLQAAASGDPTCDTPFKEWDALNASVKRTLTASIAPVAPNTDPCIVPPSAGYRSLENQLYRVEVHTPGAVGTATFKWSRDNGTVVSLIEKISGKEITVSDLGKDDVLTFKTGDWVEVSDDAQELNGLPGKLYQVDTVKPATRVVVVTQAVTKLDGTSATGVNAVLKPKLRKWDQKDGATDQGVKVATTDIALEDGVQVRFAPNGETFRNGDYWLIPARVATGDIEWPRDNTAAKNYLPQPPLGITHHFCKLALLTLGTDGQSITIDDCRELFPPLTEVCAKHEAMHVVAINWENDAPLPSSFPTEGFRITLDTPPDPASVTNDTVIVTFEAPYIVNGQVLPNFLQSVIMIGRVSVDANDPKTIVWLPNTVGVRAEGSVSFVGTNLTTATSTGLRIRVALKGAAIWNANSSAADRIYLDGQALGVPVLAQGEKQAHTGLAFPSGCCACASDFESWLFIAAQTRTQLTVKEVQLIGNDPPSAPEKVLVTIPFPPAPSPNTPIATFNTGTVITSMIVVFNRAVRPDGINPNAPFDAQSIGAELISGAAPKRLTGVLEPVDDSTARMRFDPVQRVAGTYRLTVVGVDGQAPFGGPAVRAADDGSVIDGDYSNEAGGNFVATFQIVAQRGRSKKAKSSY